MHAIRAKARDNARTPMQWNSTENAGFTEGIPWYRVNPNYTKINVEQARKDPDSIFYHYQKLISLRKENDIMVYGTYYLLFPEDEDLYIYTRTLWNRAMADRLQFSVENDQLIALPGGNAIPARYWLSNYKDTPAWIK